jgi:hypothetical protein
LVQEQLRAALEFNGDGADGDELAVQAETRLGRFVTAGATNGSSHQRTRPR